MTALYTIHWRRLSDGRTGKGAKQLDPRAAEALAAELNQEYPDIEHQAVAVGEKMVLPES